ncbi:hypothetical protein AQS8620_02267 [Aquimixticola soesokkakensis]|uniref:N-acetyltransferase domain-containing protein n=1 Tax=Aquimixticola soesokkakensis TaxID=1519096 RepID=A0A1Y5T4C0_9RHOB|nr:GNAT family N-acetyltransferase [Aquimixticola soesokkakensis]SLN52065.1 hypothetical protein AQS8620_02267 [Aquimixticola soesokkakensis]
MTRAPVITTDRLILREPRASDVEPYVAYFTSQRAQYTGGPMTRASAWAYYGLEMAHWDLRGYGMWAVTQKADVDTMLGIVGCWYPEGWTERELGWILFPGAEGKGYALEAALAARSHAYSQFGWDGAVSYIQEGNARSVALARRMGCTLDETAANPHGATHAVWRHPTAADLALLADADGSIEAYV